MCFWKGFVNITEVIGIRIAQNPEIYYFYANYIVAHPGQYLIVDTPSGLEMGVVVVPNKVIELKSIRLSFDGTKLYDVIRIADDDDIKKAEINRTLEKEAFEVCADKIKKYNLKMNLMDATVSFSGQKLLFCFTSESRVDFRELVRELAVIFRTRIEMRQIGVRDKAKNLGGIGPCGREFCCKTWAINFSPVSIKMVREQGLSCNPTKISGACGRLMCCIEHEYPSYHELYIKTPKHGALVSYQVDGITEKGIVIDTQILTGKIKIASDGNKLNPIILDREQLTIIKDGQERTSGRRDENLDNKLA